MVRKLALVLASLAGIVPGWAHALGLGDIDLHSYLNQPLDADIRLVSPTREDLDTLRVSLASQAEFIRAGIDYPSSLRQLRFVVVRKADGSAYIKVTSIGDFREPYADFLVELNWSNGRILREYTLLLDPPVTMPGRPAAVRAPAAGAATPVAPAPRRTRAEAAAPAPRAPAAGVGRYGPTRRNDTLWRIAQKVQPDAAVTVDQVMLALLRENPAAFFDGNINRLKAGYVLRVPDRQAMVSIGTSEARVEVRRQTRVWRAGTTTAVRKAPGKPAPTTGKPRGRLELLAPKTEGKGGKAASGAPAGAGKGVGTQQELALAKEAAEAQQQENAELQSRLAELEQQLNDMKRLSTLKDDKLAELQRQLAALKGAAPAVPEPPAAAAKQPAAPEQPAAVAGKAAPVEAQPAPAGYPNNPYVVSGYKPVDIASLPKTVPGQPFKSFAAPAPKRVPPSVQEPKSFLDGMLASVNQAWGSARANPLVAGGVGVGVLLLVLLLLVARQRRRAAAGFGESILQELQPAPPPAPPAPAEAAEEMAEAVEAPEAEKAEEASSYLSDFAISGLDSIQSDISEADPLTEADVFLAYGRFQPAEAMIKEAIAHEPERLDYKVKLLEIYYAARNRDAFEQEAQALHGVVEDHADPMWAKVVEMGEDLCPDSPLFRAEAEAELQPEELGEAGAAAAAEALEFELEQDLEAAAAKAEDNLIDFDLGEFEAETASAPEAAEAGEEPHRETVALDVDLAEEVTAGPETAEEGIDTENFAAELADELADIADSISAESAAKAEAGEEAGVEQEEPAEFDIEAPGAASAQEEADALHLDEALEPEEAVAGEEGQEVVDGGLLSEVDEVGTKLDLARAYIDMGDPEGARSILDEVLEEGSDQQKLEAQELMQQIS